MSRSGTTLHPQTRASGPRAYGAITKKTGIPSCQHARSNQRSGPHRQGHPEDHPHDTPELELVAVNGTSHRLTTSPPTCSDKDFRPYGRHGEKVGTSRRQVTVGEESYPVLSEKDSRFPAVEGI